MRPQTELNAERVKFIKANPTMPVKEMAAALSVHRIIVWNLITREKLKHGGKGKKAKEQSDMFNVYSRQNWLI